MNELRQSKIDQILKFQNEIDNLKKKTSKNHVEALVADINISSPDLSKYDQGNTTNQK